LYYISQLVAASGFLVIVPLAAASGLLYCATADSIRFYNVPGSNIGFFYILSPAAASDLSMLYHWQHQFFLKSTTGNSIRFFYIVPLAAASGISISYHRQ
jgi:hypothetical protein